MLLVIGKRKIFKNIMIKMELVVMPVIPPRLRLDGLNSNLFIQTESVVPP